MEPAIDATSVRLTPWSRHVLAVLAYVLPTFPLGYAWHLTTFKHYYESLQVYRTDLVFPLGIAAMLTQGLVWAYVYSHLFAGEPIVRGAARFAAIGAPLAWSFMVLAVAAKHHMASVSGFVTIETAFVAVHYLVVSPLIAAAYSVRR